VVAYTITLLIICGVPQTPDLLFLLHDVARLLRYEADRRAGAHAMTRAQWIILFWLERQPEVEPITVARLIDRLEARAMVERRADARDRRIWRLHLLPASAPVLEELHDERGDMHRLATAGVDDITKQAMIRGLQRMKATLLTECRHKGLCKDTTVKDTAMSDAPAVSAHQSSTSVKETV